MTKEDKKLLLKDLCARLPYGVKLKIRQWKTTVELTTIKHSVLSGNYIINENYKLDEIKPYLRPMSSMTEEESAEVSNIINEWFDKELFYLTEEPFLEYALLMIDCTINPMLFDWLNKKMFDYRGLIPKGRAIEVTKEELDNLRRQLNSL